MMATMVVFRQKLRSDDIFFPAMALLILGVVFYGFAQSYFLAGMLRAKLPNALVHVHGALFVLWIFLLVVQNALVAVGKVRWHMALGVVGLVLPPLLVVFGVLVLFDSIRRNGTGIHPELLLVGDLEELALFAGITAWGLSLRRRPEAHKRLMILGTLAMMGPAINRWPFPDAARIPGTIGVYVALPMLVVLYDLWTSRRVDRVTAVSYAFIAAGILTLLPLASMPFWSHCVDWIRHS